jgi:hypothetical protein
MLKTVILSITVSFQAFAFAQQNSQPVGVAPALAAPASNEEILILATPVVATPVENETFDDWVLNFENKFQKVGIVSSGRTFFVGQAYVSGTPLDPNFGQQLAIAYEQAMFDMRADFVLQTYGRLVTQTVRDLYDNQSSNKNDFDPVNLPKDPLKGGGRLEGLLDKAITLVDKALDAKLAEQGVPVDQIQKMTVEQKKTVYKDNLKKSIVKTAFRSMQGLVPVQTKIFTEKTPNGTAVILGIIAVQSEKTRQFAIDISKKRPSLVKGDPKILTEILPKDKNGYLSEIGLRFTYDESGRPMLISYGRTSLSVSPDWKPSRVGQSKKNAQDIAKGLAEASIVEFMNTNVQIEETIELAKQEEEILKQVTEFEISSTDTNKSVQQLQSNVSETISSIMKKGKTTTAGDLRGTSTVSRWDKQDENGVWHVGTVVSWTYDQLDNAKAIDAQASGNRSGIPSSQQPAKDPALSSKPINKMNDF